MLKLCSGVILQGTSCCSRSPEFSFQDIELVFRNSLYFWLQGITVPLASTRYLLQRLSPVKIPVFCIPGDISEVNISKHIQFVLLNKCYLNIHTHHRFILLLSIATHTQNRRTQGKWFNKISTRH